MATRKTAPKAEATRTLLVERRNGAPRFKVTIPANAKVTFSAANVGAKFPTEPEILRIYVGTQANQIACFRGVQSFRDLSLAYEEELVEYDETDKGDSRGNRKNRRVVSRSFDEPVEAEIEEDLF